MNNELYHWNMRLGEEAKNHKYSRRELVKKSKGKNIYRYYYGDAKKNDRSNKVYTSKAPSQLIKDRKMADHSKPNESLSKPTSESNKSKDIGFIFVPVSKEKLDDAAEWVKDLFTKEDSKDTKPSDYWDDNTDTWDDNTDTWDDSNDDWYKDEDKESKFGEPDNDPNSEIELEDRQDTSTNKFQDDSSYSKASDLEREYDEIRINDPDNNVEIGDFANTKGNRIQFDSSKELEDYYRRYGNDTEKAMADEYGIKEEPCSPEEDMAEINEKYEESPAYQNNCWSCSISYDMRRRGFDVEAIPDYDGAVEEYIAQTYAVDDPSNAFKSNNIWSNSYEDAYGEVSPYEVAEDLESKLVTEGNGARGIINVSWDPTILGWAGHAMAWEIENDKLVIRDCQSNETYSGEYLALLMSYTSGYQTLRTDNLELQMKQGHKNRVNKN